MCVRGCGPRLLVDVAADFTVDLLHVRALDAQRPPQPVQLLGALVCARGRHISTHALALPVHSEPGRV